MSLEDARAIEQVLIAFTYAADEGEVSDVVALFTADAVWSMPSATWTGREAIAAGLEDLRRRGASGPGTGSRHVLTNCLIDLRGANRASARSLFQLVVHSGEGPLLKAMGGYVDEFVRTEAGWRIGSRTIVR